MIELKLQIPEDFWGGRNEVRILHYSGNEKNMGG